MNNNNFDDQTPDEPGLTDDNMWELNFDGWTLGEDAMYMYQLSRAQQSGNLRPLFPHWSRMIRHWPFKIDPRDLKAYADLGPEVHQEIIERINRGIRAPKRPDGRSGGGET